jgi:hypothetical protein
MISKSLGGEELAKIVIFAGFPTKTETKPHNKSERCGNACSEVVPVV